MSSSRSLKSSAGDGKPAETLDRPTGNSSLGGSWAGSQASAGKGEGWLAADDLSPSRKVLIAGLALTGTRSVVVGSPNAALRPAPGLAPPRWSFEFVTNSFYVTFGWRVKEHLLGCLVTVVTLLPRYCAHRRRHSQVTFTEAAFLLPTLVSISAWM